jgi:hypothetical protein
MLEFGQGEALQNMVPALLATLKTLGFVLPQKKGRFEEGVENAFPAQELPVLSKKACTCLIRFFFVYTRRTSKIEGMIEDLCQFRDFELGQAVRSQRSEMIAKLKCKVKFV